MAELRATPMVNPVMGLLADRLKKVQQFGAKPFGYENPPVEMLMNLLGVPAVQQTMERMAYGEPLTTGRGMTTKPRAEAVEAAMTVAPVAGLLGKATKGLPVGASIKNVGDDLLSYRGSHTAPDADFGAPLYDLTGGGQMYPADVYSSKAAQIYGGGVPYDQKAFSIAQQYKDKPNALVTIYRAVPKDISNSEKLATLEKQMAAYMKRGTLPKDADNYSSGSKWYDAAYEKREQLRKMPDEPSNDINAINAGDWVTLTKEYAKDHGESVLKGEYKILSKKVKAKEVFTNADSIHEFGYQPQVAKPIQAVAPQQEALDTAQRNAALPIEEGGLGLPKDNTPEMRAQAMGYDVDAYHGTNTGEILAFDPALMGKQSGGNLKASFFADRPSAANYYINETPENVVIKPQYAEEYNKIYSKFTNDEAKAIEKFNETYDKNIKSTVQIPWDEANPEVLALKNQARKSADDYFGKYFDKDIVQDPKYFDKNPEGLVYPVKLNTKGLMDYDAGGATWTPYQDQRIKSLLAQEGRTLEDVGGVNISNSYDADVGQKIGVYGIADPSRVRSRFAAFDPMRRNEPDLLAGVLPLGLLTDEDQRNKLYEMLPSLLGQ